MTDYQQIAAQQGTKIVRMRLALLILREFGNMGRGFDAEVRRTITEWIDEGMEGPIPYPTSPFFREWAERKEISNIDGHVGYRMTGQLTSDQGT